MIQGREILDFLLVKVYKVVRLIEEIKEMWLYLDSRTVNEVVMFFIFFIISLASFISSEHLAHS
jgi:hypothetical protein